MSTTTLSPDLLGRLAARVAARLGLHFPPQRWADLERGLRAAAAELGYADAAECARSMADDDATPEQVDALADQLTVGETYFFRETPAFRALEERILPELAAARRGRGPQRLRAWSAGCCTGEEPYSLAIALSRAVPDPSAWDLSVLATDLNGRFLRRGAEGVFGEWSFRSAPPGLRERYFTPTADGRHAIAPRVRQLVTFARLNLADDAFPSRANGTDAMDVIFCRNVLIYLGAAQVRQVVARLARCLTDTGWLVLGAAESSHGLSPELVSAGIEGAPIFRPARGAGAVTAAVRTPTILASAAPDPWPVVAVPAPVPSRRPARAPAAPLALPPAPAPLDAVRALYDAGRYDDTIAAAAQLRPADRDSPAALALLARAAANLGRLAESLARCDQALAADKLEPALHHLRATIAEESGDAAAAAESLRRAIYLDGGFVMAHVALANLERRRGRPRDAARAVARAREILAAYGPEDVVPESGGLAAGRLAEMLDRGAAAGRAADQEVAP